MVSKYRAIIIPLFLIFILAAVFVSVSMIHMESYMHHHQDFVTKFYQKQAIVHLERDDFRSNDTVESTKTFNSFFWETLIDSDIIRIKVWDKNSMIIYSDEKTIIGLQFPDNKNLQMALNGTSVVEEKFPDEPENIAEIMYSEVLEIYVPITFNGEMNPSGVIEVYYNADKINKQLQSFNNKIFITLLISFVAINLLIYLQNGYD